MLAPMFFDRADAGLELGRELLRRGFGDGETVVVGIARGGVEVAAVVADLLGAQLDALAVRKIGHPYYPELALGAVAPGGVLYLAVDETARTQLQDGIELARREADALDGRLHRGRIGPELGGAVVVIVDDGLATGATAIAALRWARRLGPACAALAVPVGAAESLDRLRAEADVVVCPYPLLDFGAVGCWYENFAQVDDRRVVDLLERAAPGARLAVA